MSLDRPKQILSVDAEAYARNQEFIKQAEERLRIFKEMNEQGKQEHDKTQQQLLELSNKVREGEEARRLLEALTNNRPQIAGPPAASPVFEPVSAATRIEELHPSRPSTSSFNPQAGVAQNYPSTINPSQLSSGFQPARPNFSQYRPDASYATSSHQSQINNPAYGYQSETTFSNNGFADTTNISYQEAPYYPPVSAQTNLTTYQPPVVNPYNNQNLAPISNTGYIHQVQERSSTLSEPVIAEARNIVSVISVSELHNIFQRAHQWVKDVPPASYCEIPHTRCAVHKADDGRVFVQTPAINGIPHQLSLDLFFEKWKAFVISQQQKAPGNVLHQQPHQSQTTFASGSGFQQAPTTFQGAPSSGGNMGTFGGSSSSRQPAHTSSAQQQRVVQPQSQLQNALVPQPEKLPRPHPQKLPQSTAQKLRPPLPPPLPHKPAQPNPQKEPQPTTKPQPQASARKPEYPTSEGSHNSPIVIHVDLPKRRAPGDADKKRLARDLLFALGKRTRPVTPPDDAPKAVSKKHVTEEMAQQSGSNPTPTPVESASEVGSNQPSDVPPSNTTPRPGPSLSSFSLSGPSAVITAPSASAAVLPPPPPPVVHQSESASSMVATSSATTTAQAASTTPTSAAPSAPTTTPTASIAPYDPTLPTSLLRPSTSSWNSNPYRSLVEAFPPVPGPQQSSYQALSTKWQPVLIPTGTAQVREIPAHTSAALPSNQPVASSSTLTSSLKVFEYRPAASTPTLTSKPSWVSTPAAAPASNSSMNVIGYQTAASTYNTSLNAVGQPAAPTSTSSLKVIDQRRSTPLFLPDTDDSETEQNEPRGNLRKKGSKALVNRAYVLIPTPSEKIQHYMQQMQKTRKGKEREHMTSVATSVTGEVSESEEDFSVPLEKINVIDKAAQEAIRLSASRMEVLPCRWDGCDVVANCAQTLINHLEKTHKSRQTSFTCLWTQCGRRCHTNENHVEKHASSPHKCAYKGCSETFRSGSSLLKHFRRYHKTGELKPSARPVAVSMKSAPKGPTEPLPAYLCMSRVAQPTPIAAKQHAVLGPWVLRNINESDTCQIWQKKKNGQARNGSNPNGNPGIEYQYLITRTSRPSSYLSEPANMQLSDIGMNSEYYDHTKKYADTLTVFSRPRPGDDVEYLNSPRSPLNAPRVGLNKRIEVSAHHDTEGRN